MAECCWVCFLELVALFDFCRISDDTLEVALNSLALPDIAKGCHNFYSKVTISLARVKEKFNPELYLLLILLFRHLSSATS